MSCKKIVWMNLIIAIQLGLTFVALAATGCQSAPHYISPQIQGRVLDSASHQPIEGVEVRRVSPDDSSRAGQAKGGEKIGKGAAVYTDADGSFVLDSQRDLAFIRKSGWFSVNLSFRHNSYESLIITYMPRQATNNVAGEPLIKAGDIYLRPTKRSS